MGGGQSLAEELERRVAEDSSFAGRCIGVGDLAELEELWLILEHLQEEPSHPQLPSFLHPFPRSWIPLGPMCWKG